MNNVAEMMRLLEAHIDSDIKAVVIDSNVNVVANVVNDVNDVVNNVVNNVVNGEGQMRKLNEMSIAKSVVPMIFIEQHFKGFMLENTIAERQVVSAAIFRTLYRMGDGVICLFDLEETLHSNIEYMLARNRNEVKGFRAGDVSIPAVIKFMGEIGFLDCLGVLFFATEKFTDLIIGKVGYAPLVKGQDRRVSYIKGGVSQPSPLMKEGMDFLGETGITIHKEMLSCINLVKEKLPKLDVWKKSLHTILGSNEMDPNEVYTTELDGDGRGRMYNVAHYGPNAQKDDINRSLIRLEVGSYVMPNSFEFDSMMNEYKGLVGNNEKLLKIESIVAMYKSPVTCLHRLLTVYKDTVSNPFSVLRFGMELGKIIIDGGACCYIPVGLDAKCSGSQIYGILAGDMDMMASCGFSSRKVADPYERVAKILKASRNDIKRPYMVVQYGGGLNALSADKEFVSTIVDKDVNEYCGEVISAVESVMGEKILRLRELLQRQVYGLCEEHELTHIRYHHIDGFIVDKPVCGKVDITAKYSSIRYQQYEGVIDFGSEKEGTGIVGISDRTHSREEFARTFVVNYIQGLDALIARKVAVLCKERGIEGLISIHDCFRVAPKYVHQLMDVIREAYIWIFIDNDPLQHLFKQLGLDKDEEGFKQVLTKEMVYEEGNYFFGQ